MKWALIALGVVAGLIAVVAVVGMMLPRDHVASMSARIAASPDSVWAALTDVAAFTSWRKDLTKVELLPATATGPSWREHSRNGPITFVADAFEPPRRLVSRIADTNLAFGGSWEYRIEPDGPSASTVTITERGSVYNPIFRFVSRFVMGHTATIDAFLRALARRFGSDATPTAVSVAGGVGGT